MTRYNTRTQMLAICLSMAAGYVDAVGFQQTGGLFVSFMSGNTTRLAVGLSASRAVAGACGALIGLFVIGSILGSLIGKAARWRRRPAVLAFAAVLLVAAWVFGGGFVCAACMALAMGAENAVFEEEGDVRLGLTYMTGALAKAGQRIALAMTGGPRFEWFPYLLLWAGLLTGAALGACVYRRIGLDALWVAIVSMMLVAGLFAKFDRPHRSAG